MNKKIRRDLIQILVYQFVSVPLVILMFKYIEPKKIAAIFASVVFIGFGIFGILKSITWPNYKKEVLFWLFCLQLVAISLPIFLTRILNWNSDFSTLQIFSIPAADFHKLSERFGLVILVVLLFRLWQVRGNRHTG